MTKRQYGETQSLEAPEIDLAAQAPEFHQQVSDGIQVSHEMHQGYFTANDRSKMASGPSYCAPESLALSSARNIYQRLYTKIFQTS